ncbi:hypothetical protein KXR97_21170, partial [Xanthomonas euvesicatoria]
QVLDRHTGISFAQEADDLFFRKTLLHVQSPRVRELDSKLRCYSKSGGRRAHKGRVYNMRDDIRIDLSQRSKQLVTRRVCLFVNFRAHGFHSFQIF